jgi:hypothetical protein
VGGDVEDPHILCSSLHGQFGKGALPPVSTDLGELTKSCAGGG